MIKVSKRFFLIFIISYLIHQCNVNGQLNISAATNQPISNSTLSSISSYTSQSSVVLNQTLSPLFTSAGVNSTASMTTVNTINMTTSGSTAHINTSASNATSTMPSSANTNLINITSSNMTRASSTVIMNTNRTRYTINSTRATSVISFAITTTSVSTSQQHSRASYNLATKYRQYVILFLLVHFLFFIFPIH